jgi:ABC-type amino acid transport substrate-binding protein
MHLRRMKVATVVSVFALVGVACASDSSSTSAAGGSSSAGSYTGAPFTTLTQGTLLVASCLDYAPFENVKNGEPYGFDIDMTNAIAAKIGFTQDQVQWKKANFDTIFTAVANDAFDLVAAAATATGETGAERAQVVTFSDYYYDARLSFAVNPAETPDLTASDQMTSDQSVGVQKGTTGAAWAIDNLEPLGVTVKTYQVAPDAFRDLSAGNVTAVVNDEPSSYAIVQTMSDVKVVEAVGDVDKYAFAFAPTNQTLVDAWNWGLAQVIADGEYETIFQKYFPGTPVPPEYTAEGAGSASPSA